MTNEIFFAIQFFICLGALLGAVRLGVHALIALVALQGIIANLFIMKQIYLFGFTLTCSDVFAIGCMLGLSLIQEYYGKESAKLALKISFCSLIFFTLVSQVHLWYIPAPVDYGHPAFATLFSATPRIVISSLIVYFFVQQMEIHLFGRLKSWFQGKYLALRMLISLFTTQGIDTVLFSFAALYGVVDSILDIMLVSFFIKCIVIGFGSPLAALSRKIWKEEAA